MPLQSKKIVSCTIRGDHVKRIFFLLVMILMCIPGIGRAQANFTPSELDTLVSNIALYPDPLLVHVLTASTFGNEIPAANAWALASSGVGAG